VAARPANKCTNSTRSAEFVQISVSGTLMCTKQGGPGKFAHLFGVAPVSQGSLRLAEDDDWFEEALFPRLGEGDESVGVGEP
jgi:hypothetical protein